MVRPPGMSEVEFNDALDAFRQVVGSEWVFTGEDLQSYLDPFAVTPKEDHSPGAAVAPGDVDEVRAIMRAANERGVPVWPVSTGRNFAYGGASPVMAGTVTLDLKRMNRILEVNETAGYALVEPGVSYFDLYKYLQDHNIKLWIDCPSPGWGSVLGNTMDRGLGYTPYGDHLLMQCGMEVVLADGDIVRTGMGAVDGSNTWQLFKYGFGPYLDGMFTQSNYGVVTKMGIWLMPEPPGYRGYLVTFPKEDDLHQVVEIVRGLRLNNVIPNAAVICNNLLDVAVKQTRADIYDGDGPVPLSVQQRVNEEHKLGMWNFYGALYGPPPMMDMSWQVLRDAFSQVPGAQFYTEEDRPNDVAMQYRSQSMQGIPHLTEFSCLNWRGTGGAHTDFSPVAPVNGDDAMKQYEMVRDEAHSIGFDYLGEFIVGWRDMHHIYFLVFNALDPEERDLARNHYLRLTQLAADAGYASYRGHIAFQDAIKSHYNFNDGALGRLHKRIKDAVDPNGILAPGKAGIWPDRWKDS